MMAFKCLFLRQLSLVLFVSAYVADASGVSVGDLLTSYKDCEQNLNDHEYLHIRVPIRSDHWHDPYPNPIRIRTFRSQKLMIRTGSLILEFRFGS